MCTFKKYEEIQENVPYMYLTYVIYNLFPNFSGRFFFFKSFHSLNS